MTVAFDPNAPPVTPRDAATVILLRDGPTGLEVFFVKRHAAVQFMGGAYVFPGGKLDAGDADPRIPADLDAPAAAARLHEQADDAARARALHVAAARECLEEAGVLFAREAVAPTDVAALRHAVDKEHRALAELLPARGITLRLEALVPFARWITPKLETRRFDARFFLAAAPAGVLATHDERETVASEWLAPREALARAAAQQIVLVPPTHRTVEMLAQQPDTAAALAMVPPTISALEPVVVFDPGGDGTVIVALPGDPLHPDPLPVVARAGSVDTAVLATRFVYRDGAWQPGRAS